MTADQTTYWKTKNIMDYVVHSNSLAKRSLKLIKKRRLKTLLDLGVGRSRDPFFFVKNKLIVTALDVSKDIVDEVKKEIKLKNINNLKVLCKSITKLDFPKHSFDVVYAHLSVHYFDDNTTTKIFNNIHNILKKGGLFIIKCKSTDDEKYGVGRRIEKDVYVKGIHVRHFFSKEYMRETLRKFKILNIRKTSSVYKDYKSSFIEAIAIKE